MKSKKQCRGMSLHFDLMPIYNANRPTKPQNYFIYTHQTTRGGPIYTHVRYKHKNKNNLTGLPNNKRLSKTGIPVPRASSAHANDKLHHASSENSEQKLNNKNYVSLNIYYSSFVFMCWSFKTVTSMLVIHN